MRHSQLQLSGRRFSKTAAAEAKRQAFRAVMLGRVAEFHAYRDTDAELGVALLRHSITTRIAALGGIAGAW